MIEGDERIIIQTNEFWERGLVGQCRLVVRATGKTRRWLGLGAGGGEAWDFNNTWGPRSNPLGSVVDASGSDPHYINQRNTYWGSGIIARRRGENRGYLFMIIWLWRKIVGRNLKIVELLFLRHPKRLTNLISQAVHGLVRELLY